MSSRTRLIAVLAVIAAVVMVVTVIYATHVRPACRAAEYVINSTEKILNYDNKLVTKLNITNKKILEELNRSKNFLIEAEKLVEENKCSAALTRALRSLNIAEHIYVIMARKEAESKVPHKALARAIAEALAHMYMRYFKELGIHNETVYKNVREACKYCTKECSNMSSIRKMFNCVLDCYEKKVHVGNILRLMYEYRAYVHVRHVLETYLKMLNNIKIVKIVPPKNVNGVCKPGIIEIKIGNRTIEKTFNCTREGLEEFHNYVRMMLAKLRRIEERARALYMILPLFINNKTFINKLRPIIREVIEKAQMLRNDI
ncbi:MAG: hypothetical protein GXO26_09890, partial [Crenarchaeota archaeon]|nr:hypothetical protein [Thermoproteota archaeon]